MSEVTISRSELQAMIRTAVKDAFHEVGLRTDAAEHVDEAREDMRFLRRFRKAVDGAAGKIGMAVLLALVGGAATALGLGLRAMIGRGIP